MIEGGEDFRLALKTRQAIRIAGQGGGQHLDRDRSLEIAVGRAIDLAHATGADGGNDFVRADTRPGSQRQVAGLYGPSGVWEAIPFNARVLTERRRRTMARCTPPSAA